MRESAAGKRWGLGTLGELATHSVGSGAFVPWNPEGPPPSVGEPPDVGERKLLRAVLESGVKAAQNPREPQRAEARAWIASDNATRLYAFVNVCDALNVSADWIRRQLRGPLRLVKGRGHHALVPGRAISLKPHRDQRGRAR